MREPAPVPSQLKPSIPQDVSDLILRALVKDPARRTPSAAALREEIEAVMAHHRFNSSPAAVAQFFKDTLGERLAEFGPTQNGPFTGSFPSVTGSNSARPPPPPPTTTGEMAAPMDTRVGARSVPGGMPAVASAAASRPPAPPAAPAEGEEERTEMYRPAQQGLIAPQAMPPPPPPLAVAPHARPTAPARPSLSHGAGVPAVPPRASLSSAPAVPARASGSMAPPAQPAAARMAQVAQAPAAHVPATRAPLTAVARPPAASAPGRGSALKWVGLGALGVLILAGAGLLVPRLVGGGGVEVINLEPGEQLFIAGLHVDDVGAMNLDDANQHIVSTAVKGKIHRFGIAVHKDVIDVHTLPEAQLDEGSKATLHVGGTKGCFVKLGNAMAPGSTPISASIEAGKVLEVSVACLNQQPWSRAVLAMPDQEVEVLPPTRKH